MKRLLLLLVCIVMLVSLSAGQITIQYSTFSSMFPTGGPIRFHEDTLSLQAGTIQVGHKGGPQIFDFSGLTLYQSSEDTIRLVSYYPFLAQRFDPTAITFKILGKGQGYEQPILRLQSSGMTQMGQYRFFSTDTFSIRHNTPAELFLNFPITLGDSVQGTAVKADTMFITGLPPVANSNSNTKTMVVDGWGTLLLPGGKSYACLRVRDTEALPNNSKEFRYITDGGGMLFVNTYNTEPDTGMVLIQDPPQYIFNPTITSVARSVILPTTTALEQNYPNPFNPETAISFQLSAVSSVKLTVYDLLGRVVAKLVDQTLPAGAHRATWNASAFPSGVYFYKLETSGFVQTKRMIVVK